MSWIPPAAKLRQIVCRLAAIRHCSAGKIDMQIYAQILVISPVLQPLQRRLDGCVPSTLVGTLALPHPPRKPVPSFSTSFSPRTLSLSLSPSPSPSFSLSSCLRCSFQQQRRVLFLSACSVRDRGAATTARWEGAAGAEGATPGDG